MPKTFHLTFSITDMLHTIPGAMNKQFYNTLRRECCHSSVKTNSTTIYKKEWRTIKKKKLLGITSVVIILKTVMHSEPTFYLSNIANTTGIKLT